MNSKYDKTIERVKSGKYSRKELETLRANAIKNRADDVVNACEEMLSAMPEPKASRGASRKASNIAVKAPGYDIMESAYDENNNLIRPELIEIAEFHANNQFISDISILKTQIKLYYKGRHFTSGSRPTKGLFWIACLDETKILDKTIRDWEKLGKIVSGTYFSTRYIGVEVTELNKLNDAFDCVRFTS